MAKRTQAGGGEEAFFAALEALTWREHRAIASLIALQLEGAVRCDEAAVAQALANAAESFGEAED